MPTHDDPYVAQLKARKRELQLQLKTINTEMASIRANYSQKLGTAIFWKPSRRRKDKQLHLLQPQKEQLQAEIQAIQEQINRFRA